ncbi:lysophospholipid acyltransferase family protein [Siccirubricoccus sp. KC 17139]|uniref:Lysophospholipid acyltransferase family protein n=1 Tax=Siccirubricoccus soli TaxID=2899147 RepID=A0ABT1D867_9PROT|nr:lysophospholipid acyltransferase family protein [Siccirubricoccus soli]MCO6418134.1 lysophospholipid acyltransferase family protein [Siccirubricoccus soli]MCP2684269.1 lysophospholipid acyltransferase family protein [Siccirubricoccus soli]
MAGREAARGAAPGPAALFSPWRHAFFRRAFLRFARRHLRAVRLAAWGAPAAGDGPLVVFANHPSWWDGVAFMLLSDSLFPGRRMMVPMDAEALARYGFMRRIGVFGVEQHSARGALGFLRVAEAVLALPGHMLWLNAPGRFCDVRERPVPIAPGLVRLAELAPRARFLPLALEYPFWTERAPEMLAGFGTPLEGAALAAMDRAAREAALRQALEATMDRLAADAVARDPSRFLPVLRGREGMGGFYQAWRWVGATLRGRHFDPRHDPRADGSAEGRLMVSKGLSAFGRGSKGGKAPLDRQP